MAKKQTIKIFRESGVPIKPEEAEKYRIAFGLMYDRCEEKATKAFEKNFGTLHKRSVPRMTILQRLIRYGERLLVRNHNFSIEVEFPKSSKAWTKMLEEYQAPIAVAQKADGTGNVLMIMDERGF